MSVLRQEIGPDYDVSIFDVREPGIDVFFLGVRLGGGEEAIEIGGVRFVLLVVLERMNIDLAGVRRCFAGLERRRHAFNITRPRRFCTAGNPWMRLDVLCHRTIKEIG
ncbi:MAG TPA: hypothetical protein VK542_00260 [Gemmatimonadaceae bacterium]|nr:hypothetical protein [Gemmatimonadaceae bacterium]